LSSQFGEEFRAGIAIFEKVCSKNSLTCTWKTEPANGDSVRFILSKDGHELPIRLGREFVADLPGTKEFQSALEFYLAAVALRFGDPTFEEYATMSGIPVRFRIGFPFRMSTSGVDLVSVHVRTETGTDTGFEARLSVHLTDEASVKVASLEPIVTEALVVNAVRKFVDSRQIVFYPNGEHRDLIQAVAIASSDYDYKAKRFVYHRATEEEIAAFLKRKVYWLGFRRGNQATRVCIADPYDAAYLGVSTERLQQTSAILAADGYVQIDASGLYANAGTKLLLEARGFDGERAVFFKEKSPERGSIPLSSRTSAPEGSLFDVFVSHATEDKSYVEPLVKALEAAGIRVWYDKSALEWGDDLRSVIDRGLSNCRYGIVVFSKAFLGKKKWTEYELNSLFALERVGRKVILPIWHGITRDDLIQYSPAFADRLAKILSTDSHGEIVEGMLGLLGRSKPQESDAGNITGSVATKQVQIESETAAYAPGTTGGSAPGANAFADDLERQARQVVGYQMTFSGQQLLRQLLIHGTFPPNQQFMPEISIETQNEQMKIAKEAGIVKQQPGTPAVAGGFYTINPRFLEALKKVVYEGLAKHR
jgi:TIR domain